MIISEAVKKAIECDGCISFTNSQIKIKPTNGNKNCILMHLDGSHPSKTGWQPTAEQLIREDWIVVD